jgi:hypothetical protein
MTAAPAPPATWAIEEFTTDHWVSVQHTPRSFPI